MRVRLFDALIQPKIPCETPTIDEHSMTLSCSSFLSSFPFLLYLYPGSLWTLEFSFNQTRRDAASERLSGKNGSPVEMA